MKVTQLVTSLGELIIQESVDDILAQRKDVFKAAGDADKAQGHDFNFTILNTKNEETYKASCVMGVYRMVREIELADKLNVEEPEEAE